MVLPSLPLDLAANHCEVQMHQQLKAAIVARVDEPWTESLPIVLLGMRKFLKRI